MLYEHAVGDLLAKNGNFGLKSLELKSLWEKIGSTT
jgi:hypothetical protein